jgi:prepilin-type N-terminal cleavage/methylation domain-containing protein
MKRGFTLVETLIALMLVTMAMLSSAMFLSFSLQQYRLSLIRFESAQKLENMKDRLLSSPFESGELADGCHSAQEEKWKTDWVVSALSGSLKRINIAVSGGKLKKTLVFYKSKLFLEVNDD